MEENIKLIQKYFNIVKSANKELPKKEAFKDLLNRLYSKDEEIQQIIDKITLGSETAVVNIPRKDKLHYGSADSLYNNIIIEFENDLKLTGNHAKEQLAGYLLGQFKTGVGYNFTLISTDCINWKVYVPDISCLDKLDNLLEDELILNEVVSASFTLTEKNSEDFYYWIDRFLFKEEKQKATLKSIEEGFGHQSLVFIESYRELYQCFNSIKASGTIQVSFEQWYKFLSIAYGTFNASEDVFIIHTYLSIFSKMLAYSVVSNDDYIDDNEMRRILDGSIFHTYNITNFVDNDFFHWVNGEKEFKKLKKAFRLIAQEISHFDFANVEEDVLKGVYQELIDLDTRHSLGEYYTPDWLCERIVQEFDFKKSDKILDPSCGSGSFLRAIIHRIQETNPDSNVEDINKQIYGIDIHPLSVQITKTTILLSLGKEITKAKKPVHLNIILANTLLAPEGINSLFGSEFVMHIDKERYRINTKIFDDVELFDSLLDFCEELAEQTTNKNKIERIAFDNIIKQQFANKGLTIQIVDSFYLIYKGFKKVKENGRDSIWKFIISNLYKPYFLSKKFNYVIGNPPWFTFRSIKNEDYQNILNLLAQEYNVKPQKVANYPHLEIAAIFQSYCGSYFLKDGGEMAFVLPRSFFSADHHDNTRSGIAHGFRLTQIWDLQNVKPLFRVPACVLFSEKAILSKKIKASGLEGKQFSGKLPSNNCHYNLAVNKLVEQNVTWYLIKNGNSSAFSTEKNPSQKQINHYKSRFRQGATIVPRAFYFIDLDQETPDDFEERIISIKTAECIKVDAKKPWKEFEFSGRIESRFLFRTALSKSILPFALFKPTIIVLPIEVSIDAFHKKRINIKESSQLITSGNLFAAKWFSNAESIWDSNKTEKNGKITLEEYLNWQNKLTEQDLNSNYIVMYMKSAKDANATLCIRQEIDLEFIIDYGVIYYTTNDIDEAHYLLSILNSSELNSRMKAFQSTGLFGPRNISKKILDISFPKYDKDDMNHKQLASLGQNARSVVTYFLGNNEPPLNMTSGQLGRLRLDILKHLTKELTEINTLVKKIIK